MRSADHGRTNAIARIFDGCCGARSEFLANGSGERLGNIAELLFFRAENIFRHAARESDDLGLERTVERLGEGNLLAQFIERFIDDLIDCEFREARRDFLACHRIRQRAGRGGQAEIIRDKLG